MQIHIRVGAKSDIPRALELVKELAVYEKAGSEVEVTTSEMEKWGFGAEKVFSFIVAEVDDKVVGLALYYYKYSTWKGKCIYLEDIIVTESMRGKGIGKLLFEEILKVAKQEGVRRLEWQVLEWNEPAINFYKKYPTIFDPEWINCKFTDKELNGLGE